MDWFIRKSLWLQAFWFCRYLPDRLWAVSSVGGNSRIMCTCHPYYIAGICVCWGEHCASGSFPGTGLWDWFPGCIDASASCYRSSVGLAVYPAAKCIFYDMVCIPDCRSRGFCRCILFPVPCKETIPIAIVDFPCLLGYNETIKMSMWEGKEPWSVKWRKKMQ